MSRREKTNNGHKKDTRWDRIRKKHSGNCALALKSDAVRRFIEMDFIGKQQERLLNGEVDPKINLNPQLVMDLRHEMFQKIPKKLPLATVAHQRNLDKCKTHNYEVEERYINNELNRFRTQLAKQHKLNQMKIKIPNTDTDTIKPHLKDTSELVRRLETTAKLIEDFKDETVPVEALEAVKKLCQQDYSTSNGYEQTEQRDETNTADILHTIDIVVNQTTEEDLLFKECLTPALQQDIKIRAFHQRTPSPLTTTDEMLQPMRAAAKQHQEQQRCVRFEQEVEIRKYQRENSSCSNTSDGIDSVISDLAEEALIELQIEEQAMMIRETQKETEEKEQEYLDENETIKQTIEDEFLAVAGEAIGQNNADNSQFLTIKKIHVAMPQETIGYTNHEDTLDSDDEARSTPSNHEQNRIIEQLFQSRAHTKVVIMRKYFLKWIHYTTIAKIEKQNFTSKNDRANMINSFLDKIRKEKKRLAKHGNVNENCTTANESQKPEVAATAMANVQMTKKYQNKIKIQQDIIDLQRLKLERQERMIMQLKLNKLSEETKEARQEIKDELKSFIRSGDPKTKAKAKCLQLIGNLKDAEDDEFARLQIKALMMPKFLQNMQERALERSIKHEQARQRRLQHDAEREALKIAAEEAKRLEDEEAKRLRLEALREKRRQEKMSKVIKERERQRAIESHRKSQEFCRKLLLKRVGFEGFRRILQRKRDIQRKCEKLRIRFHKKVYFQAWRNFCLLSCEQKIMCADNLYEKLLKRDTMRAWKEYLQNERSKFFVAVDWYELKLSETVFRRWYGYNKREKMIEETKMFQASSHHAWHLKWKVIDRWQTLPQILQLERETEERRQRWRMKIWELLPDYTPNRDEIF